MSGAGLTVMRDEPDWNNKGAGGDPTILKRQAKTQLLVSDGHTASNSWILHCSRCTIALASAQA